MKYEVFLAHSVSLKQSAVQIVSFLPPTIQLQVSLRKQRKTQYITTAKEKKKTQKHKKPTKNTINHTEGSMYVVTLLQKVLAPYISTAPSHQVPCVQLVSWMIRCNFLCSFSLGLTLQVEKLI